MNTAVAVRGLACGLFVAVLASAPAAAAEMEGITVTGSGTVKAMPDVVAMAGVVQGEAELAGDAITKFRGNKRRVFEAMQALGIEGLKIEGEGFSLNTGETNANAMQRMMMGGMGGNQPALTAKVSVAEKLNITLGGVDKLEDQNLLDTIIKIVDAGKDVGLVVGPSSINMMQMAYDGSQPASLATFQLSDVEPLKKEAYEKAMADARANAQRLAELAGVKLGRVLAIQPAPVPTEEDRYSGYASVVTMMMMGMAAPEPNQGPGTATYREIPVTVNLLVRFEILGSE